MHALHERSSVLHELCIPRSVYLVVLVRVWQKWIYFNSGNVSVIILLSVTNARGKQLREGKALGAHSLRVQTVMTGKAWWQRVRRLVTSNPQSGGGEVNVGAQLAFSSSCHLGP